MAGAPPVRWVTDGDEGRLTWMLTWREADVEHPSTRSLVI